MCTERKATGLFVLTSFLCDNDKIMQSFYDVVILSTQQELSGSSLICVKSVKIVDKDLD